MTWGKVNLVTNADGSDLYKCALCKYKKKYYGLARSPQCPKCQGTGKRNRVDIFGYWSSNTGSKQLCLYCKSKTIVCPKENHPNSILWRLQRTKDEALFVCPNGCYENGSGVYKPSKLKRRRKGK